MFIIEFERIFYRAWKYERVSAMGKVYIYIAQDLTRCLKVSQIREFVRPRVLITSNIPIGY